MDKRKKQPKREIEVDFSEVETARGVAIPPGWWRMKNGRFVEISKMALSHLQLAMSMMQEKGMTQNIKYRELAADLDRREMEIVQRVINQQRLEILNRTPTPPTIIDPTRPRFFSSQNPFMGTLYPVQESEPPTPKPEKKRKIRREKK